jgi:uncharacterized membrane protein YeaQ/YmgE (transglycosylase-associated protein family)
VHFSDEHTIVILLVGVTAGFLTSKLVRGTGLGMIGDGAVGIVGAFASDWLLLRFHFHFGGGVIGLIVRAAIGAIVVVLILRMSGASRWGAGRYTTRDRRLHEVRDPPVSPVLAFVSCRLPVHGPPPAYARSSAFTASSPPRIACV